MSSNVQLAKPYTGFPKSAAYVLVEPKLDGYRLVAYVDARGDVELESRQGNAVRNLDHIKAQLKRMGFRNRMVDGEIIVRGKWTATALVKKRNLTAADRHALLHDTVFHVFDVLERGDQRPQTKRRAELVRRVGRGSRNVKLVPQYKARNDREVRKLYRSFLAKRNEGAIVKLPDAPYRLTRSSAWLKIKPTRTIDAKIVGAVEGKGMMRGKLGAWKTVLRSGKRVNAIGGTHAQRAAWWKRRQAYVGKWIEIVVARQKDVSEARDARMLRFRDDLN